MQIGSEKASSLDLLSVVVASLSDGYGLDSGTGDVFVENRLLIDVVSIIIAVLVGCMAIFFVWRSSGRKPVEPPKPLMVKTQMDIEEDQGKKKVTVFFGTQTRTAEGFAKVLVEEAKARYPNGIFKVMDIDEYATKNDEYEENLKKESLALFFLATYGDGEPTYNAAQFYKWFTEGKERGTWLENLQFGVFSLGNQQYEHFNKVAVVVDELLHEQDAKHIVQVGLGDDDQVLRMTSLHGMRELLWPELDKLLQDENETGASTPYTAAIPEYRVVFVKPEEVPYLDKSLSFANGHAIHDIQHPCRSPMRNTTGIRHLLIIANISDQTIHRKETIEPQPVVHNWRQLDASKLDRSEVEFAVIQINTSNQHVIQLKPTPQSKDLTSKAINALPQCVGIFSPNQEPPQVAVGVGREGLGFSFLSLKIDLCRAGIGREEYGWGYRCGVEGLGASDVQRIEQRRAIGCGGVRLWCSREERSTALALA
ncbi:hypothetical protein ZIOFF_006764 [Zingiber officinale]|uniref:Flavodoxin-like domain-containing protein n=1 Tax=Zingiber officinale TaxID=94328 RepID=A0A8J5ICG0_ZINOF|nr:hypothetical protein ZIOFF_006764 [Zingiber officinale]